MVKTGHGFIHLGGLFVLSRRFQLWFLEFRGLLFEINVRAFLTESAEGQWVAQGSDDGYQLGAIA